MRPLFQQVGRKAPVAQQTGAGLQIQALRLQLRELGLLGRQGLAPLLGQQQAASPVRAWKPK